MNAEIPVRRHPLLPRPRTSAGSINLYSAIRADLVRGEPTTVSTGLSIALPDGFVGVIRLRPGLALAGSPTIGSNDREPIFITVVHCRAQPTVSIAQGEQIGTVSIYRTLHCRFSEVEVFSEAPITPLDRARLELPGTLLRSSRAVRPRLVATISTDGAGATDDFAATDSALFRQRVFSIGDGVGPYDIEELVDLDELEDGYLDLGSVLLPRLPEIAWNRVAVEFTADRQPETLHLINGQASLGVAAFTAPVSGGLWRTCVDQLIGEFESKGARASRVPGVWADEVLATINGWSYRVIGADGPRWMVRAVLSCPAMEMEELTSIGRALLRETVVRRGVVAQPVNSQLAIELPADLAVHLDGMRTGVQTVALSQDGSVEVDPTERSGAPDMESEPRTPATLDESAGPYDYDDLTDVGQLEEGYLDLGSVFLPIVDELVGSQVAAEFDEDGQPSAVTLIIGEMRLSVAAFAAGETGGLWPAVAAQMIDEFTQLDAEATSEAGPWAQEVVAVFDTWTYRAIGVDGPGWLVRAVMSSPTSQTAALTAIARDVLRKTVVRLGPQPRPGVGDPMPIVLPVEMVEQLEAAAGVDGPAEPSDEQ